MTGGVKLAEVIGTRVRAARRAQNLTLDQVALAARARGLRWSEPRVSDFEAGKVPPNLAMLAALSLALTDLGCEGVSVAELCDWDSEVELNPDQVVPGAILRAVVSGTRESAPVLAPRARRTASGITETVYCDLSTLEQFGEHRRALAQAFDLGASDARVKKALDISDDLYRQLLKRLWGKPFTAERDSRAGDDASPQKRGRVSRQMYDELRTALAEQTRS